jgi:REP element-mobilizing transposase RayT
MLVSIPPKMGVSRCMGIIKEKSSLMIFDRFANFKYKHRNRTFGVSIMVKYDLANTKNKKRIYIVYHMINYVYPFQL